LQWAQELDRRVTIEGGEIVRLHFSGCSASCAQPQIADVGFRGETAKTAEAIVEGVDIGLGGSLGRDAAFIDWVEGAKPVTEVPDAMVRLFDRFAGERREGERFYEWARRMPKEGLRGAISPTLALTPLPARDGPHPQPPPAARVPGPSKTGEGAHTSIGGVSAADLPEAI
jgi:sulfite reductase beta subunit-like hemoprotein